MNAATQSMSVYFSIKGQIVIQNLEAELLHGKTHGEDDMMGAADPDRAVRLQDALAAL